jgi:hypothetical protein
MLMLIVNRDSAPAFLPGHAVPTTPKVTNFRRFASEVFEKFSGGHLAVAHHDPGPLTQPRPHGGGAVTEPRNQRASDAFAGRLADELLCRGEFLLFSCGD